MINSTKKIILNQMITCQSIVLDALKQHLLLALLFATEQKYTFGAAMESAIWPPFHKQVSSVIGGYISKNRRSAVPSATGSASSLPTVNPTGRRAGLPPSEAGH
ncbi:hypothetical protein ACQXXB_19340 [Aeromonas veronii]|uniref:hypothetical protein n=1 Tax=Aeromonas veronii TaxID=654 RepID=UPI003D1F6040